MRRSVPLLLALAFVLAACQTESDPEPMSDPDIEGMTPAPTDPAPGGTTVGMATHDAHGAVLVDGAGRSLYLFTADTRGEASTCYDACAEAWPPLLSSQLPAAGAPDVQAAMLGTVPRADGSQQVAYGGWPLYYYARDRAPGEVSGQDVESFGGEWYLVGPDGEKVDDEAHAQ